MFENILVVCKDHLSEECLSIVNKVRNLVLDKNFLVVECSELKKPHLSNIDLVITIGGDGTFIKASNLIKDAFILGINPSPETSEGALTNFTKDDLDDLKTILEGNFKKIQRQRAQVKRNGVILDELALNEVYVGATLNTHSSRYILKFKDKEEEHRSAGVIITTGTGSPAWYKSVGGNSFHYGDKKLAFKIREPYFGKIFPSKILQGEIPQGEKIVLKSTRNYGGVVAIGMTLYDFNNGDTIEIELSDTPLNVIVKS